MHWCGERKVNEGNVVMDGGGGGSSGMEPAVIGQGV